MENIRHYCRKCVAQEGEEDYFSSLSLYIENVDPQLKVSEEDYKKRLTICENCARLTEGMCSSCGCFVILRALMIKNQCPWGNW
jgi:hypothetical protein